MLSKGRPASRPQIQWTPADALSAVTADGDAISIAAGQQTRFYRLCKP